ncbi:MAG: hypothetical protein IJK90_05080 [Bacteroidales bacterium]|nr:hypothetical protein [Bacteroidales bacterium]
MFFHKKKRSRADKLPEGVTIENGLSYLNALDEAISRGIWEVEPKERQTVLNVYKMAYYAQIKTVDAIGKKIKEGGAL